ncbi:MAG: hypothetical protein CMC70_07980 [Flavobacteriaceae bacterium]|nr:hypothetical protein [Flavobacteriaceae bacterium]
MYKLITLFFIVAASCGTPKNTSETSSESVSENGPIIQEGTITLSLGETARVGDLVIQFKEVLEDSRCPTGMQCVWQGRAKILVETSEDGMPVDKSEIIFGRLKNGETENHTFYKRGTTTITATAINPYPTDASGTKNLPYALVLEIGKE